MKEVLNAQQEYWEDTFAEKPDMFGTSPSEPAKAAAEWFKKEGAEKILELGSGQGRDTLFFARSGFRVYALDYSEVAIRTISEKAEKAGVSAGSVAIYLFSISYKITSVVSLLRNDITTQSLSGEGWGEDRTHGGLRSHLRGIWET